MTPAYQVSETADVPKAISKPAERSLTVDVVKGIAISLMVLGHTNQGIMHRGWYKSDFGLRLGAFIYSFHMPAFFFVSGIFICSSLQKRGWKRFVSNKVSTILYPYFLWSVFASILFRLLQRWMLEPVLPFRQTVLSILSGNMLWFLAALFSCVMIAALLHRLPLWLPFIAFVLAGHYWHDIGVVWIDRMLKEMPFVIAGMWVGLKYEKLLKVPAALSVLGAALIGWGIYLATPAPVNASQWRFVPLGLLGTLMLFLLAHSLGKSMSARALAWVGVASLGVYLLAQYGQGAGRLLLQVLHLRQPALQLIVPTIIAIVSSAWLYQKRERLHIGWMFMWPSRNR